MVAMVCVSVCANGNVLLGNMWVIRINYSHFRIFKEVHPG